MPVLAMPSFAKGEVSPSVYARVDTKFYKVALRTARNTIIHPHGGVSNRPGTLCIGPVKDHDNLPRIFRFHLGTTDQYVLEFGDLYMRVIRNDGHVLNAAKTITAATAADPVVLTSAAHGFSNGDDIYVSQTTGMIELHNRRFIVRNQTPNTFELENQITGVSTNGADFTAFGGSGTLTASTIYEIVTPYVIADVPTLKMVQTGNTVTITHFNYQPRDLTRADHDSWTLTALTYKPQLAAPTNLAVSPVKSGAEEYFYKVTSVQDEDNFFEESLPTSAVSITNGKSPPDNEITWTAVSEAQRYAVYRRDNGIYGLLGETELTTFNDNNIATDLTIGPPRARNPFGTFYPQASGYYQQRQVYGGTTEKFDTSWYSQTGLRLNMSVSSPLQADDAIVATLASQDVQEIRHYVPMSRDLIIMTNAGEWRINSGPDSRFSADTIKQEPEERWGSSHHVPIVIGKFILFVEDGEIKVRTLKFSLADDGWVGADLMLLADHLLANEGPDICTVLDWTHGLSPEARIYVVRSDGSVLTVTFLPGQEVVAWTTWDTKGKFKACTSLRRSLLGVEDGIYFVVERETEVGSQAGFIERLESRKFDDVRDAYFVDGGYKFDIPVEITGITTADPGVFTAAGHGFVDGDLIQLTGIFWDNDVDDFGNETQPDYINNRNFTVANAGANTFELLDRTVESSGGFDLTTIVRAGEHDTTAEDSRPRQSDFNADGTKWFVSGRNTEKIYRYSLSPAYDIRNPTYDNVFFDASAEVGSTFGVNGFRFGDSGTKFYLFAGGTVETIFQYNMTAAYDIENAAYSGNSFDRGPENTGDFTISDDGGFLYQMENGVSMNQWALPALWSLGTNVPGNVPTLVVARTDLAGYQSIQFKPGGKIMYLLENAVSDFIHEYSCSTAFSLALAVPTGVTYAVNDAGSPATILFNPAGTFLYISLADKSRVQQYTMTGTAEIDLGLPITRTFIGACEPAEARLRVTQINGLACLEGLSAKLLLDGNVEADQTVTSNKITVDDSRRITRGMIGHPYTCDIGTLDIEAGSFPQTLQGKKKKIPGVMVRFKKSRMPLAGPHGAKMVQMRPREFEKYGEASGLLTGDAHVVIPPHWNSNGRMLFRMKDPLPVTILGVFPDVVPEDELE
ncbi:MAG: hypothetical protein V3V96_15325 [Acidiferrobacterales bacterium]